MHIQYNFLPKELSGDVDARASQLRDLGVYGGRLRSEYWVKSAPPYHTLKATEAREGQDLKKALKGIGDALMNLESETEAGHSPIAVNVLLGMPLGVEQRDQQLEAAFGSFATKRHATSASTDAQSNDICMQRLKRQPKYKERPRPVHEFAAGSTHGPQSSPHLRGGCKC